MLFGSSIMKQFDFTSYQNNKEIKSKLIYQRILFNHTTKETLSKTLESLKDKRKKSHKLLISFFCLLRHYVEKWLEKSFLWLCLFIFSIEPFYSLSKLFLNSSVFECDICF